MNKTAREYYKEIIRNGTIINFRIPISNTLYFRLTFFCKDILSTVGG